MKFFSIFFALVACMASAATVQVTETCRLCDGPDFRSSKQIEVGGVKQVALEGAVLQTLGAFSFYSRVTNAPVWTNGVKAMRSGWVYTPLIVDGAITGHGATMVDAPKKGAVKIGVIGGGNAVNIVREAVNAWQVTVNGVTGWIWAGAAKEIKAK